MTPVLVFDIETIPDASGLRVAWDLADHTGDEAVVQAALERRRLKVGHDFLPHHLHRVVAISCVFRDADGVRVRSLGSLQDDEPKLIQDFFRTIDRYRPQLVSWNGGGFDLPVLNSRAMIHGIPWGCYWETGERERDFRYNNYLNRYHSRHLDLMDMLAMFTGRANAPLDEMARLCGFPGKLGMDGSKVWDAWREGQLAAIRNYCETDVANTWLMYCRHQLINCQLSPEEYRGELALFRRTLEQLEGSHWAEYLAAWR